MEGFSERTIILSSILELLTVTAITPMQAVGAPPIRILVTGITARIADEASNIYRPSDGGVHAGSDENREFVASA